jgi:ABC-2 type transport system ATP-binding protein
VIEVTDVSVTFQTKGAFKRALSGVSIQVDSGQIHAILGPNGAGKTTLLRTICGLQQPTEGSVRVCGHEPGLQHRDIKSLIGLVPSGARTFYLRLTGLENLLFFARLNGLRKREGLERSMACIRAVGLEEAARIPVRLYSHGMTKRLGVARALLVESPVLVVDEATHDLDPEGARQIQALVADVAAEGGAVIWATQRVEEIRGFAHGMTLLDQGTVRFAGTVGEFLTRAGQRQYLMSLEADGGRPAIERVQAALGATATVTEASDREHLVVALPGDATLAQVVVALDGAGITLTSCWEDRSGVEAAFLALTSKEGVA